MIKFILNYAKQSTDERLDIDLMDKDDERIVDLILEAQTDDWYLTYIETNFIERTLDSYDLQLFVVSDTIQIDTLILDILDFRKLLIRCNDLTGLLKLTFTFRIIGLSSYGSLRLLINKINSLLETFSITKVVPLSKRCIDTPSEITRKIIEILGIEKAASMYRSLGFDLKGYNKEIDAISSEDELDYYAKHRDSVLKKYFDYTKIGKIVLSGHTQIFSSDERFTIIKPVLPSGTTKAYLVFIKTERNN